MSEDRIGMIGDVLRPEIKREDWIEAVALAISAFDEGIRSRNPKALPTFAPALWANLRNKRAAMDAFHWLLDHEPVKPRT